MGLLPETMAQYNHLPIFQRAYRLALETHRAVHQFPREHKYALGAKLKEVAAQLLDLIVEANSRTRKTEMLEDARIVLERFRIHLRLASDLEILGLKRFEAFNRSVEEISKQLAGWLEWSKKTERAPADAG